MEAGRPDVGDDRAFPGWTEEGAVVAKVPEPDDIRGNTAAGSSAGAAAPDLGMPDKTELGAAEAKVPEPDNICENSAVGSSAGGAAPKLGIPDKTERGATLAKVPESDDFREIIAAGSGASGAVSDLGMPDKTGWDAVGAVPNSERSGTTERATAGTDPGREKPGTPGQGVAPAAVPDESPAEDSSPTDTFDAAAAGPRPARSEHPAGPTAGGGEVLGPGRLISGRWELSEGVAVGGQATVWRARDRLLDRVVALKVYPAPSGSRETARALKEARILQENPHPHLVRAYDAFAAEGRIVIAMEWLSGGSLRDIAHAGGAGAADTARWLEQALSALSHLHNLGIYHRDIKPGNLLLDAAGDIKLADLGMAWLSGGESRQSTRQGGTPEYMSPERLRGAPASPLSDLYELGVSLREVLTGRQPAPPTDPGKAKKSQPSWLRRFLERLSAEDPRDRYPDAAAAMSALAAVRPGAWWSRFLAGWVLTATPRQRRRALLRLALTAVLITLGILVWRVFRPITPPVRVVVKGERQVCVVEPSGRVRGTFDFECPIRKIVSADIDGDGVPDTVIAAYDHETRRHAPYTPSRVIILNSQGRLVSDFSPDRELPAVIGMVGMQEVQNRVAPSIYTVDLDLDGCDEVLLNCIHVWSAPTFIYLYRSKTRRWSLCYCQYGYLSDFAFRPARGGGAVRCFGFNNRLGMQPMVMELQMRDDQTGDQNQYPFNNPYYVSFAYFGGMQAYSPAALKWYTLLPQHPPTARDMDLPFQISPDLSSTLRLGGPPIRVDGLGNPSIGPNGGKDYSRMRVSFAEEMIGLTETKDMKDLNQRLRQAEDGYAPILREAPCLDALDIQAGVALWLNGSPAAARERLARCLDRDGNELARWQLAEFDALQGRFREALARCEELLAGPQLTPAGGFSARQLRLRLLIEVRDKALLDQTSLSPDSNSVIQELNAALMARARLWWDEPAEADTKVESWDLVPWGDAVACLAKWRLGWLRQEDLESMQRDAPLTPEAFGENAAALAAAQLALGRSDQALKELESVMDALAGKSRRYFEWKQTWDLVRALHARALLASGLGEEARREALALRESLQPRLLPRILVEETLSDLTHRGMERKLPDRRSSLKPLLKTTGGKQK